MSFKKDIKIDLNNLYNMCNECEKKTLKLFQYHTNNEIKIKELDKHCEIKWTEHQKRLNEHYKKIEMLINSENEVRLAIKTIAEILEKKGIIKTINKGEQKNERSKSKSNNSKQSIPKHSKQRIIQK